MATKKKKTVQDLDMQAPQEVQEAAYDAFMTAAAAEPVVPRMDPVEAEFKNKYGWIMKGNIGDTLLCILKELVAIRWGLGFFDKENKEK